MINMAIPHNNLKDKAKKDRKGLIHFGNAKFNLTVHMMLGIRQSVRNVQHLYELEDSDYDVKL
jgi:hypothetical protein